MCYAHTWSEVHSEIRKWVRKAGKTQRNKQFAWIFTYLNQFHFVSFINSPTVQFKLRGKIRG